MEQLIVTIFVAFMWAWFGWQIQGIKRAANMAVSEVRFLKGRVEDGHDYTCRNVLTSVEFKRFQREREVHVFSMEVIRRFFDAMTDWKTKFRIGPSVPELMWLRANELERELQLMPGETRRVMFTSFCEFNLERLFVYGDYYDDGLELSLRIGVEEKISWIKYTHYLSSVYEDVQVRTVGLALPGAAIIAELRNITETPFKVGAVCLGHKKPRKQVEEMFAGGNFVG